ncbi:MAG TPA: sigma-54 dependent transcriptional regulator [Tepidisphaeraceae bacterium]
MDILVVDDEANIRKTLAISLEADGHRVVAVSNPGDALAENERRSFDLLFLDLRLGTAQGMDLIPGLLAASPWLKIVIITAYGTIDTAVEAMKRGAADYLTKPFTPGQVAAVTERVAHLRALEQQVAGSSSDSEPSISLETSSPPMRRAISLARQVAPTEATVLIRGESGTGKGVLARLIHAWSKRGSRPFGVVSCPAISPQLLESELFGHVRGAFTGAVRDNPGRIAACDGGTLFLDEIGDLPLGLQPKLLRFAQDRQYERVGDSAIRRADVRMIAATNIDLEAAVKAGRFREDLLYRIQVIQIDVPPLRQRVEDVVALAEGMLRTLGGGRGIVGFTPEAVERLRSYAWPGNVRELRNAMERAAIFCQTDRIGVEHLPGNATPTPATVAVGDAVTLDELEEVHIRRVLASTKSLDEAARTLGIDAATLWRRRKKYGI